MSVENKMMHLIGMALFENLKETDITLSDEELSKMYSVAEKHDITNIVGYSLKQLGILPNNGSGKMFERKIAESFLRYLRIKKTADQVYCRLEKEKIEYIPLKGEVIGKFYPEPWLRTSCDIDILVHSEDVDKTAESLKMLWNNKREQNTSHDITVFSDDGVHIEIHYKLLDKNKGFISYPWRYSVKNKGSQCAFTNEFLYCYYLAHMAKHIQNGGCGLRSFIDFYFLKKYLNLNEGLLNSMLKECELLTFNEQIIMMTDNWFSGIELNELQKNISSFILKGGAYGNAKNSRKVTLSYKSKPRYLLGRIWASYDTMKIYYPSVKNRKFLLPFYQVMRWINCIIKGRLGIRVREMNNTFDEDENNIKRVKDMIEQLQISPKKNKKVDRKKV